MKVFISYASEDKALAGNLEKKLKTDGFIVYRDKSTLKAGDKWRTTLVDKIQSCDFFILLWSTKSARSPPVLDEILTAHQHSRTICPCLIDKEPILPLLEDVQYIKLHNLNGDYKNLLKAFQIELDSDDEMTSQDILHAISTYKEIVQEKYGKLRVLYESREEPIEEAYVELSFQPGIDFHISSDSIPLLKMVSETEKNINIMSGHPGTGKTSTLHYLMYTLSKENFSALPIFGQLKKYDPDAQTFEEFLKERIYIHVRPSVRKVFEKENLFEDYKCVVLLDGLDELSAGRYENVKQSLKDFYTNHPTCRIILTTRIDGFKGKREKDFNDWAKYTIAPLDEKKIKNFIQIWFRDTNKESTLIKKIKANPRLYDLANRPFLLALICLVFQNEGDIRPMRSSLYEKATAYLLESRLQNVSSDVVDMRSKVLQEIALRLLQMQKREFNQRILETMVAGILHSNHNFLHTEAMDFLNDLVKETGIVQYYENNYQFIHQSFQEYYAARALQDILNGQDILVDHCQVPGWEEPIRLYAGLINNKREQEVFVRKIWKRHPALALRTASECEYLASKFLMELIQNSEASERIGMLNEFKSSINTLSEADARRITIETLQPLFKYEKDSAVLYFGIALLQQFDPDDKGKIMYENFYKDSHSLFNKLIADKKYKFEFISIPAGEFKMGDDKSIDLNEQPAHNVFVDKFEIAKYQLTNLAYETFMGIDSSQRSKYSLEDDQPVVNLNWYDAYICALKIGCRLPTEAEWEYSARADSTGNWCFGDDENILPKYAHYYEMGASATRPVGSGLPNNWGLHDVHGNVWEWCADWFWSYSHKPQKNPNGPSTGKLRVRRGGGWLYHARGCRCAFRYGNVPDYRYNDIGVRLVRNSEKTNSYLNKIK